MVPVGLFFCMRNPTIFRKRLIRVNDTRCSVQMKQHQTNFQKKTYTGQFIVELIRVNKMAYKGHLRQPPQSYILTNIQRFKSKRGPEGSFRRETALRTKHITPGYTF